MRGVLLCLSLLISGFYAQAYRVIGKVVFDGEPLAYASIHVKGSTYGVLSNGKGEYFLELSSGNYTIVCEYIGMKAVEKTLKVTSDMVVNFDMYASEQELGTLVLDGDAEDPAYGVIRKAIERKKSLNQNLDEYTCNMYLKASLEKENLNKPDTVNDNLVTKKRVNFVESYSDIYYKDGAYKEVKQAYNDLSERTSTSVVVINFNETDATQSTTVINPELFFTKITDGNFDFTQNLMDLPDICELPITSPISNSAFLSYKYKLLETFYEGKDFVAKIRVTPKYSHSPLFSGIIFISKNTYTIKSVDLSINSGALRFFDNFNIIQDYSLVKDSFLLPERQEFYYETHPSKNKATYGHTLATYTNYKMHVPISKRFMNRGQVVYADSSTDVSTEFWQSIRPTGLKKIEQEFVRVQDSIRAYHASTEYLDMSDSLVNHLDIWDYVLNGIVHRNHEKGTRWYISPLVQQFQINNIDGYRHRLSGAYTKTWTRKKQLHLNGGISYGIVNENIRGYLQSRFMYNPKNFSRVRLYYANQYQMINDRASINATLSPSNYAENVAYGIGHEREWLNGFFVQAYLDYDTYKPFSGETLKEVWDLFPQKFAQPQHFDPFEELVLSIKARITFKQKYEMHPHHKVIIGSDYPVLEIHYKKGIKPFLKSDVNYDYLQLGTHYKFKLLKIGITRMEIQAGRYLNDREVRLSGLKYIRGSDKWYFSNPLQTPQLINSSGYQTAKGYFQGGLMHHFKGQILGKVPIIKHTRLQLAGGAYMLLLEDGYVSIDETNLGGSTLHGEFIAGLERPTRIWKQMFRFGVYYAVSENTQSGFNQGIKFGIDFYNPVSKLWQY